MTEINNTIINMINENKSLNEICDITNLSSKQLFYRLYLLKIKGYDFSRKYYYNGDITYNINKDIYNNREKVLITDPKDISFRAIILSDLHIGNEKERLDLLDKVYSYAIKNNYNIIINAGDVIDGLTGNLDSKKYTDIIKQVEYALKVYPYDKSIINFICLGNHDYDAFIKKGVNIETAIDIKRHDLVSLGYGVGKLNIKNDCIKVRHPKCGKLPDSFYDKGLIIEGHSHMLGYKENGHARIIQINSLSNVMNICPPGFMTINSNFVNGILCKTTIESFLYFEPNFIKTSEYQCDLSSGKNNSNKEVINEEHYKKLSKEKPLTQIEKFNKKYNK